MQVGKEGPAPTKLLCVAWLGRDLLCLGGSDGSAAAHLVVVVVVVLSSSST